MPRCSRRSAAEPTSAQMPIEAERTAGIVSVMTRTPLGRVVFLYKPVSGRGRNRPSLASPVRRPPRR